MNASPRRGDALTTRPSPGPDQAGPHFQGNKERVRQQMTTTDRAPDRNILGQALRTLLIVGGLTLLGWAAIIAPGCTGFGQQSSANKAHASAAKVKMEGMKAASEYKMAEQAYLAGDLP